MRLNLRWMTILTLLGLFLACAWGGVLLSQNMMDVFDSEDEAELSDNGRVERVDDDDDDARAAEQDNDDEDRAAAERNEDEDDAGAAARDDDDDDAGATEVENGFTGSIPVSPDATNPESLAEISAAEAEEIALDEEPEAQLEELGLEVENGYLVYEVELTNGREIIVDAGNGDILQIKTDD